MLSQFRSSFLFNLRITDTIQTMDAAFNNVGQAVGTEAWRIEAMAPVKLEFTGKLYSGDSYIFLHTKKKG